MDDPFARRYARNKESLSSDDQQQLGRSRVCILGLGGLGGGVCELLARIGVGHLILVDGDRFDASNLNRQILSREDLLGQSKALAAEQRVRAVNSEVQVQVHEAFARPDTIGAMLEGADLVVDCLDTIGARFMAQDAAQQRGIPLVSGAIAGAAGQVTVIFPRDRGFELIYGPRPSGDQDEKDRGIEQKTGNLAHCAMFVAALQASESIKVLLNRGDLLRNRLLIADLWRNTVEIMDLV